MPDDHTVTVGAEAHKIIIMMCAVGSTPALLGNASGTVKSRSTQRNNKSSTELRSDLERLTFEHTKPIRKEEIRFKRKIMICYKNICFDGF